jgi:hypothetical protein
MKKINLLKAVLVLSLPVALIMFSFKPTGTGYNVGDTVKDFNLKNVDGKNVSLSGMKNNKGAIVIFTCNLLVLLMRTELSICIKNMIPKGFLLLPSIQMMK